MHEVNPGRTTDPHEMSTDIAEQLNLISRSRIFFGHQSVGKNIIDGLTGLLNTNDLKTDFIKTGETIPHHDPGFLWHKTIGINRQPESKCDEFSSIVSQSLSYTVDIALFKFCYIDIDEHTDIHALFEYYRSTMDNLQKRYADMLFLHCTVPLRCNPRGGGVLLREILGRPNRSKLSNIARNRYNAMLKNHYGEAWVFDLAASESTGPDNQRSTFRYKSHEKYDSLAEEYSSDGGHLNDAGRIHVAEDFVRYLTKVINSRSFYRAP